MYNIQPMVDKKEINWEFINNNPITFINSINRNNIKFLEKIISTANYSYFNSISLIDDSIYDILIERLKKLDKNNKQLLKIGEKIDGDKTILTVFMPSMNKIKTKKELELWIKNIDIKSNYISNQNSNNNFVISEKLDGISVLIVLENNTIKLFTRGDGEYGRDISFLVNYNSKLQKLFNGFKNKIINKSLEDIGLKLETNNTIILRGELIISKANFFDYQMDPINQQYTTARSMVNGLISLKTHNNLLNLLDAVIYEVISPSLKPIVQFDFIKKLKLQSVQYIVCKRDDLTSWISLSENYLLSILELFRKSSYYEIDGIIVTHNNIYQRTKKNPKYSVAFKSNGIGKLTTIKKIFWEPSKYNILIPRIHFEMINIGSNIEYCSGFSAKFIANNNIGPGTKIRVILSGEVIPYIAEIIEPTEAQMPNIDYKWNESNTHIILLENLDEFRIKQILHFVKTIKIENLSIGLITKLFNNGYNTLSKILTISKTNLLSIDGIKETLAEKIFMNINKITLKPIYLGTLMAASLQFNSGMGIKKIDKILEKYPDILEKTYTTNDLSLIEGIQEKTASQFLDNLENFKKFYEDISFIKYFVTREKIKNKNNVKSNPKINGKFFVVTGFRDENLANFIITNNGTIQNTINKKTDYLLVKNKDSNTKKTEMANKFNIPIIGFSEFYNYFY